MSEKLEKDLRHAIVAAPAGRADAGKIRAHMSYSSIVSRGIRKVSVVLAALLLPCVAAPATADQVVTNCSNDTQLRNAWNAIQGNPDGGDLLSFNCGTAVIVITGGPLTSVRNTIVFGAGLITLSGGNSTRIFTVATGGALTLSGITLTLGSASGSGSAGDGGCIWSDGSLTLYGTIVDNCYASNDGGGIFSSANGQITIDRGSTIRNNIAQRDCGGICSYGPSLTVNGSAIDRNQAFRFAGGIGGAHDIAIDHSTVSNNTAQGDGGGVFNNDDLIVRDSVFIGNRAEGASVGVGAGGGIVNDGGSATILQSRLSANFAGFVGGAIANRPGPSVPSMTLTDVTLSNNLSSYFGGGIASIGNLFVDSSTLIGNRALAGGGIFNEAALAGQQMTLMNVTLSGNQADQYGGGIYSADGLQTLIHVTLSGNSAPFGGGIVHISQYASQTFSLRNTVIANSPAGGNCYQQVNPGAAGIFSSGANISTDNSCTPFLTHVSDRNNTNPNLGALRDNGGPTLTHMIFPPSLAIDRGQCITSIDQRGVTRPIGISCDIGAVEYQPFTDDPVTAGVTLIKAVQITELRARIDALRIRYGVPPFNWIEPSLGGTTPVRAQHILDLRTALGQAYTGATRTPPTYTDPTLTAGMAPRAVYINELRAAVLALDIQ